MRPIVYGLIGLFGGGVLWFLFSIVAALEQMQGTIGMGAALVTVFFVVFFFSIPVSIVGELVQWRKRRKLATQVNL